jgi:phosphatidylglycerophosphatase A
MSTSPDTRPPLAVILSGTVLGAGYFPIAPGTAGSAVGLAAYWLLWPLTGDFVMLLLTCAVLLVGIPIAKRMELAYGDDPSRVVLDEFTGMWVSMLYLPVTWITLGAGFFLFRLFDIVKPQPARWFDQRSGGHGIMLDDVIAGIYANLAVRVLLLFYH